VYVLIWNQQKILSKMKPQVTFSKELLAKLDLANTMHGGMAQVSVQGWQSEEGFHLVLHAPGTQPEKISIEAVHQRFVVYYMIDCLDGAVQMPYYLLNVPLLPVVDVDGITAKITEGKIYIFAPFNDWSKGARKEIALEE
jgi:HSP20 family molecular chaperone IbpA